MTTTLTHPPAEDLGRFIEGTLDDAGRAAVVDHIADCDECRIVVVDATEFAEPTAAVHRSGGWRLLAVAAALAIVIGGASILNSRREHDPLAPLIESFVQLKSRPMEARLSGFPHVERKTMRGEAETDPAALQLEVKAQEILDRRENDPRMQHAKGVAQLFTAHEKLANAMVGNATDEQKSSAQKEYVVEQDFAVAMLQSAAIRVPDNAGYQNDLAVALIATQKPANLQPAIEACDRALRIDHRSPEALFNRAIALRELPSPKKAIEGFKQYLTVDPSSAWADEAKRNIDFLQEGL
jgi:hypothetical protein